jgi:hypothetical protein
MHQSFCPEEFSMEEMMLLAHLFAFHPSVYSEYSLPQKLMMLGKKLQNQADSRISAYTLANLPSEN